MARTHVKAQIEEITGGEAVYREGVITDNGNEILDVHGLKRVITSGKDPRLCTRKARERIEIQEAIEAIASGALDTKLDVEKFHGQERDIAAAVNNIRAGLSDAIMDRIRNERMKADLITNVSHDIKTPLTSIVNYVDLLKRENLENENARHYIRILDDKSQRLKQLTEDLVEASKISSGNHIRLILYPP